MANAGLFPPDYSSPVGKVRLLIHDVDQYDNEYNYFSDTELNAYLDIYGLNVKLAAARALDAIADSAILIERKIRTDDLQTDGPAVGNALRKSAESLREEALQEALDASVQDDIRFDDLPGGYDYYPAELAPWRLF